MQKYLNMATFGNRNTVLHRIQICTFWYIERLSTSSYRRGVIRF